MASRTETGKVRQLQAALDESEARRRAVLDSALDCFICTDVRGTITEFNSAAERTFRMHHSGAIGKDLIETIFPTDLRDTHRRELFADLAFGGIDVLGSRLETRAVRANGAEFPAEITVTYFSIKGVGGFIVSVRDITARKKAEETLVRLAAIVESSEDAIVGIDLEGHIASWNRGAQRMSGYSDQEVLGKKITFLMPQERSDELYRCLAELKSGRGMEGVETVWLTKSDKRIDVALTTSCVPDAKGLVVSGSIVARDITARKLAQEALRKANETSIYGSPIPIIAADVHGNVTIWNDAAQSVFGWSADEVKGKPLPIIPTEEAPAAAQLHARLLAGETLTGIEVRRQKRDHSSVEISFSGTPLWDEHGKVRGMIGFLADISRSRELEQQLRQMQKIEAIGRLAGGVAHDFNNILMAISSYAELLCRKLPEQDGNRRYVDEIVRATDRGSSLTQGLLAFSRKQVLSPKVIDLNVLVREQLNMLERLVGENIGLRFDACDTLGSTKVDPGQVEQVVMNLVINARDAMPNGGEILIETANAELDQAEGGSSAGVGHFIMLSVSDTGCGMDEQTKAHIFEPFFTTKEQGKGTGLGLATVFGIVKQSGGQIFLQSEPGVGTTFKVYFPRVTETVSAKQADGDLASLKGKETILLVEDEASVREPAAEYLAENGYLVLKATKGPEALELAEQHDGPVHLLLTDVVMPKMSGTELAEKFLRLYPGAKVIFMSGYSNNLLSNQQVLDRKQVVLQKPFRLGVLGQRIRETLHEGAKAQAAGD
jgi:PAS domain S-box-containing protein